MNASLVNVKCDWLPLQAATWRAFFFHTLSRRNLKWTMKKMVAQ